MGAPRQIMRYTVKGIEQSTGREVERLFDASSAEEAQSEAQKAGIAVTSAVAVELPLTLGYAPVPREFLRSRWIWVLSLLAIEAAWAMVFFIIAAHNSSLSGALAAAAQIGLIFGGITLLQLGMMLPVLRPRMVQGHVRPAWIWLSGIATGFLVGIFILCLMFMAADFAWTQEFPTDIRDGIALTGLLLAGTSWLLSIPLIYAFMRRRPHESVLARISAALFLGSVVEFLAGIPLLQLVRRKESCTCATYTFGSMVLACAAGLIVLGPMILLVLFARRSRAISRGCCAACGFDLRQNPPDAPCPRCGAGWKAPPLTGAGGG
jgi:hypothetical protein